MSTLSDHNTESSRIKEYNTKTNLYTARDPDRYYLEEYFKRLPATNNDLTPSSADDGNDGATATEIATMMAANKDFELDGANHSSGTIAFSSDYAGISLTPAGADNDQMIIQPHEDTNQSAWYNINFDTQDEVIWEGAIRTDSAITNMSFWAGLKETNTGVIATDDDQAYFLFSTNDDMGSLDTNANLYFIYSVSGTDYLTDLGIAVAADTLYKLKITIDADRKVSVCVNGKKYGLRQSSASGGNTESNTGQKSLALTTGVRLYPFIALQALSASTPTITVSYEKISRTIE